MIRAGSARLPRTRAALRLWCLRLCVAIFAVLLLPALPVTVPLAQAQTQAQPQPSVQSAAPARVEHLWQRIYYGALDGQPGLLFAPPIQLPKPSLGDIDGDGDLDLLLGTADGTIRVFQNEGTAAEPKWRLVNESLGARDTVEGSISETPIYPINVGSAAAPALADLDGDGDLDLLVGNGAGKLAFYRNDGNQYLPVFRLQNPDLLGQDEGSAGAFGKNLVPRVIDLNADGVPDLSLGNEAGQVWLLHNRGSRSEPRLCTNTQPNTACSQPARLAATLSPEDNAAPAWTDWDGDGDADLFVGKNDGTIALYTNIGTARAGVWELTQDRFEILDVGGYAAPLFARLRGGDLPQLILAGDGPQVAFYRVEVAQKRRELWLETRNLLGVLNMAGFQSRLQLASGDLTGDGKPDLVLGTRGGQLLLFVNETADSAGALPAFRSGSGPVLPTPTRAFASPALLDVDGDGDLDLLVGNRSGTLELIRNTGTPKAPRWEVKDLNFGGIDVGALSAPAFFDLTGNGQTDLLVGNSLGNLVYYENRGKTGQPDYLVRAVDLLGQRLAASTVPALFLWDAKKPPDLVVGSQAGDLLPATRNPAVDLGRARAFLPAPGTWGGLRTAEYSAPHFVDLSGDGRPDLLLGSGDGQLYYWRYEGSREPQAVADARRSNVVPEAEGGNAAGGAAGRPGSTATGPLALDPIFAPEALELPRPRSSKNSIPAFADLDGDRLPDLVLGVSDGRLLHYRNLGPAAQPRWELVTDSFAGYRGIRNPAPVFHDVDGDGDLDLAVGTERGSVMLYERTAATGQAAFTPRPQAMRGVRAGNNAVPTFVRFDPNGPAALLVGTLKGELLHYKRRSGAEIDYELVTRSFLGVQVGLSASPTSGDLTGQQLPSLLVGSDKGPITVLNRTGGNPERSSGWQTVPSYLEGLELPLGSHPAIVDLDGDGDQDLVVGSDAGPLLFFRNAAILPDAPRMPAR